MTDYRGLVAALRCDGGYRYNGCKGCLYEGRCLVSNQMQDAADAIEELMAGIERIRQTSVSHEVHQTVCRERDAAVVDITHGCDTCLYAGCAWDKPPCKPCIEGEVLSSINRVDNWQWRGPQEAGKGEME